jgi:lipopolysaccharide/colanic/teichoic acid biosynthesis glycosyltransferase
MSTTTTKRLRTDSKARDAWRVHLASAPVARRMIPTMEGVGYWRWKGLLDRVAAAVLLVPGIVVIGLLVLLVRLGSRGPGLFGQTRVGRGGHVFTIYKIRTMVQNAEEATGAVWCGENDPRITRLGRILRKLHLDEFPQLFNVLRGEMSLVGPRPERPEFVHVLAEAVPGYLRRLAVSPGITGLAQLNLPPDSDVESVRRKLALDVEYIDRAGAWLDSRLLFATFLRLAKTPESMTLRALGLGRTVVLPPPADNVAHGNGHAHKHGAWRTHSTAPAAETAQDNESSSVVRAGQA